MFNISQDELQGVLLQLEQAIYNHNQWYESLIRTMVCNLPYDRRDVSKDAHRECRFGQWYYDRAPTALLEHPGFVAMGVSHMRMHQMAASLLSGHAHKQPVPMFEYDHFSNALQELRLQIQTLKREFENMLYNRDPLTGADSRIGMLTKLREMQELVKRGIQQCCLALMDLDHFKPINDTYGHLAGDHALSETASYVMGHIRPYDKLFRYGGDEFLVLLQNTDMEQGLKKIELMQKAIAKNPLDFEGKKIINVTVSFGITLLYPDVPVEESLERADKALYAAKSANGNCTRAWSPSL